MVQLGRATGRLLRTVAGKPHASSDDHEEDAAQPTQPTRLTREEEDALINADPLSSDDELPSAQKPSPAPAPVSRSPVKPSKPSNGSAARRRKITIRAPNIGASGGDRTQKAGKTGVESDEKENRPSSALVSSLGKRAAEEEENEEDEDGPMFGFGFDRPVKRQRVAQTFNIHAPASRSYGKRQSGAAASRERIVDTAPSSKEKSSSLASLMQYSDKAIAMKVQDDDDDSDLSDISMVSLPVKKKEEGKTAQENCKTASTAKSDRPNLLEQLGAYRDTPSNSQLTATPNGNESGQSTPLSSVPSSALPQAEPLHTLEQYAADIPTQKAAEDKCPLCETPVDPTHYREYWSKKKRTARHERAFCQEHVRRAALEEYRQKGYPVIDWDALPSRIRSHHAYLTDIINNIQPSTYRDLYAQQASSRQTGSKMMETNFEMRKQTGYYGSRGSHVMMDAIMRELADDIRHAARRDHVVRLAGVANFVLRVLVPEVTVRLVMEDFGIGQKAAEECIKESGELGALVNEEVADEVEWRGDYEEGMAEERGRGRTNPGDE